MSLISSIGKSIKAKLEAKKSTTNNNLKKETKKIITKTNENNSVSTDIIMDKVKEEKGFLGIKTGKYVYEADGKKTYGQIKEELDLDDGVLRRHNYDLFKNISGNADKSIPKKGTKIKIGGEDLPSENYNLKSDKGDNLSGFYKSADGTVYYKIQHGDTQDSIYKKFENKSVSKKFKTADILRGYSEYTLQPGTKVVLGKVK